MQLSKAKPSPGAFFDSDFQTIDSLLAVSLLFGLQGKDACRVAILTMSRPNLAVTGFIDAVLRFYKGPAGNFAQVPPIGMCTEGAEGPTSPAFTKPFQEKKAYVNQVKRVLDTGDPCTLIRNYLEAQWDQNAFIVLGGPATNLAAVLDFAPDLIKQKVKYLVFAQTDARLNADPKAAKKLLADWPTPIIICGPEIGPQLPFPGACIDKEFAEAVKDNPVADAYRAYQPMPYDAPSGDMAAALYAARPNEGYFKVDNNRLVFDPAQKDRIIKAYIELASAKPPERKRPVSVDVEPEKEKPKPPPAAGPTVPLR